jgi:hypothetical protein
MDRTVFNPDLVGFRLLIHPVLVLGGLLLAAGLNLLPLLRLGLERRSGAWVGSVVLRVRVVHLAVSGGAIALLAFLLGYGFVENYRIVPTHTQEVAPLGQIVRPSLEYSRLEDSDPGPDGTRWLIIGSVLAPVP